MTKKSSVKTASKKRPRKGSSKKKTATSKGKPRRTSLTFRAAFETTPDFAQFGPNALSMFALSLYLRIEDLEEFAASADVEGPDDKKLDICYLNVSDGIALMAQSYFSPSWKRVSAPSNKASDLNTAMAWMLSADQKKVPAHLRSKAIELRKSLLNGEINRIELLYIHNCPESENVENELKVVADATRDKVFALRNNDTSSPITIAHREFGLRRIEDLYKSRDSDILVDNLIKIPMAGYIRERSEGWEAILGTVPGSWIQGLYKTHGERLFSANYRDYLGSTAHKGNINRAITETVDNEPSNFWVYNNGITALTHEIKLRPRKKIRGISIINGAQTTGSLSEAVGGSSTPARVMIRIVQCSSKDLINSIIRYNNTQNDIKPADRRSKDMIQKRLGEEFDNRGITYVYRRSGGLFARNAITCVSIGAPLCAFHGDPQTAFRLASDIFNNDEVYQRVFPPLIAMEHIFLVRTLSVAIDKVRIEIKSKVSDESATDVDLELYEVLKFVASKHFLLYLIGELADQIMDRRVADKYNWRCRKEVIAADNVSLINAWIEVLKVLLPHISMLIQQEGEGASYEVPRSFEKSKKVAMGTKALVASLPVLANQFEALRARTAV